MSTEHANGSIPTGVEARNALTEATATVDAVQAEIDEHGEERVVATADAYRRAIRLLDQYEETATGTGDFKSYLQFQSSFLDFVSELSEEIPAYEGFSNASDRMDKRRLSQKDFDYARDEVAPARTFVELLEQRSEAIDAYRTARSGAKTRLKELRSAEKEYARLTDLTDYNLDVPIDELKEPIEAYNNAVTDAFTQFKTNENARKLFNFIQATKSFPLVNFEQPPPELIEYIQTEDAGEKPLPKLLDLVDYSSSKLDHYVSDPGALRTNVAVHRTFLDRITAEPLTIEWPPAEANELQFRLKELSSVTRKLGDESLEGYLRTLRRLTNNPDFTTLRDAAAAKEELDDETLSRIVSGEIVDDYEAIVSAIESLELTLEETKRDM
ncbi:hypothetical protein HUB97_02475 [Halorubraceae archaeon YAN]|nr:hypothetical protein [Halorubraceae archaeon YAN]